MPTGAPLPKLVATKAYGAQGPPARFDCRRSARGRSRIRGPNRSSSGPPVRPRGRRGGAGDCGARNPRATARGRHDPRSHRRRRVDRRSGRSSQSCTPAGPHRRSAGRDRGCLAGVVGSREADRLGVDVHDGRRYRRWLPWRGSVRRSCRPCRRRGDGQRGSAVQSAPAVPRTRQAHRRTGRRLRPSRP